MAWVWLGGIASWTLACSVLLAAFSTFDAAWVLLLVGGAGVTLGWLGMAAALSFRRRWSRQFLLYWAAWPAAVGVVGLLHATDLPMTLRVVVSQGALSELVESVRASGRTRGRAGLVWVFDARIHDGCGFLKAGESLDGVAGLLHVPDDIEPPYHPDWSHTVSRHLTGPWWYFETRS